MAAAERGHEAFALTDHNSLSGSMEFAQTAKAVGVKAIHGAEIDVAEGEPPADPEAPRRHLTLLVRDERGWRNLCRLLTRAHAHTRGSPDEPPAARRDLRAACVTLADVEEHAEGLVCLSGCAGHGVHDEPSLRRLLGAFGRESLRVELQRPFMRHDRALNRELAELAARVGVDTVATGDIHAHTRERALLQDAFVAIREHTTLDASEPLRRGNHSHVLTTPDAMAPASPSTPGGRGDGGARRRAELRPPRGPRLPLSARRRPGRRSQARGGHGGRVRRALPARAPAARRGAAQVGGGAGGHPPPRAVGLLHPAPRPARAGPRGRGGGPRAVGRALDAAARPRARARRCRRSSATSPASRTSTRSPTGCCSGASSTRRSSRCPTSTSTSRATSARSSSRACTTATAASTRRSSRRSRRTARAVPIREIGKALGLPPGEIERVARSSEAWSALNVDKDIAVALGKGKERRGRWAWLAALSEEAHGLPRHLSQHSGGMIVSTRPLVDCVPLVPAAMEGRQLAQWDKDSCSDAGFLKIDLLGLGMLSAVERCVDHIASRRGEHIDLSRIPFDDPETYASIQAADTTGVFQIESRAQMASLHRTRPETLDDITIQVAIVRPGPIVGGAVNPYITRRQRLRVDPDFQIPYEHPSLEEPLRDTLGTIIFQDQVIEVARAFAGFTHSEAEGLRRAMSRKRSEAAIRAYTERFVEGAQSTHPDVDEATARPRLRDDRRVLGVRIPQGARRGVRPARLPVGVAARALRAGVRLLAARRAAHGLLSLRRARARGAAARHRGAGRRHATRATSAAPSRRRATSRSGSATCWARGRRRSPPSSPSRERDGPLPLGGGPRVALGHRAPDARAPGLVRRVRRARRRRSPRRAVAARRHRARLRVRRRGDPALAAAGPPGRPALEPLTGWPTMVADYAIDGPDDRRASHGPAARRPRGARRRAQRRPARAAPRAAGPDRGRRRRAPAPRHGEGRRLHAARGRARHDQPRRAAGDLRARAARRARPSRSSSPRGSSSATRRRAARSTSSCARSARSTRPIVRSPRSRSSPGTSRCRTSRRSTPRSSRGRTSPWGRPARPPAPRGFRAVAPPVQSFAQRPSAVRRRTAVRLATVRACSRSGSSRSSWSSA